MDNETHITHRTALMGMRAAGAAITAPTVAIAETADDATAERLMTDLRDAMRVEAAVYAASKIDAEFDQAYGRSRDIAHAIEVLSGTSITIVRAKALAAHWCGRWNGANEPGTFGDGATADMRLLGQIIDALIAPMLPFAREA